MKRILAVTAGIMLLCLGGIAQAVTIDTVPVGNPGNTGDYRYGSVYQGGGPASYGSVGYTYNIGKYEVTAGQYTAFLNAVGATDTYGLYNTEMDTAVNSFGCNIKRTGESGSYTYSVANNSTDGYWANRPVNFVSYWDSCRFANWLHNSQPTGLQDASTTETGAYTLTTSGIENNTITRNVGVAKWAVTSEDEWYKAAYYEGGSTSAVYWLYPTHSSIAPANQVLATDPGNSANYWINSYTIGSPFYRTNVGEFEKSGSAYGTFDQGGNVWEWNEAIIGGAYRGLRGGSFDDGGLTFEASYRGIYRYPGVEDSRWGFRVSEVVPEPSSLIALAGGLISLLAFRRRRA